MPMQRLKTKIRDEIGRDQGKPLPTAVSPDEQADGWSMDDIDRTSGPEGADITSELTPAPAKEGYSGLRRKSGQLGTT